MLKNVLTMKYTYDIILSLTRKRQHNRTLIIKQQDNPEDSLRISETDSFHYQMETP